MENNKIKIAQIIGHTCNGGVESFVMNYYKNIDKKRFKFYFFVDSTSKIIDEEIIEELSGEVIITPKFKNIFSYLKFLNKIFSREKFDIVHCNLNTLNMFPLFIAKINKIKVRISHSHSTTSPNELFRNMAKNFFRLFSKMFATHYFACSIDAGKRMFGKKIVKNNNFFVIKNGIDLERFSFNEEKRKTFRQQYNIKDETLVGTSGRFAPQKNHLFLLECFNLINKRNELNKIKLIIIGEGKLKNDYQKYIDSHGLQDYVLLLNSIKDVEYFYNAIDLFVFPSIYEGLGISLIEAQANGLPCIISEFIPSEAMCNDNVFIEKNNLNSWIYRIEQCVGLKRIEVSKKMVEYDIKFNTKKLECLYLDFFKKTLK